MASKFTGLAYDTGEIFKGVGYKTPNPGHNRGRGASEVNSSH